MSFVEANELNNELLDAMRKSNFDGVVKALEKGASPNAEIAGVPMVLYAAQRELWDILDELYVANADMNVKHEIANWTLLHQLCATGRIEEIKSYLPEINNGYEKDTTKGQSAVMVAVSKGYKEIFEILVEKKVDFRQQDKDMNNLFHYLAKVGWIDMIEKYAVNPVYHQLLSAKNKDGDTVLSITGLQVIDLIKNPQNIATVESVGKVESTENIESVENESVKPKLSKLKGAKRL